MALSPWLDGRDGRDQQQRHDRADESRQSDGGEAVAPEQKAAERRAHGQRHEHCRADPGDHLAGVTGAGQRQAPALRAGHDEAFCAAEERAAHQQYRNRQDGIGDGQQGKEVTARRSPP